MPFPARKREALGCDHPLHFRDDLAQVDGLAQHLGAGGGLAAGGERHGGEAGDEHDPQLGIARGGLAGHLDAVEPGHDDVGQQQVPLLVQHGGRLVAIGAGGDVIAGPLQGAGEEAPEAVVVFGEDTPRDLVRTLQPDVIVKGGDYMPETVVGASDVVARGGRVVIIPLTPGQSTTGIINKMRGRSG